MKTHSLRRMAGTALATAALCATAVGVAGPAGAATDGAAARTGHQLTDEQKQCLSDQGITRPVRPLTEEKIAQLKAAAAACGIERPGTGATSEG